MAGPVTNAVDEQNRAILAIGAQTGDAGVAAYKDAQSRAEQVQSDALARAHLEATQIGAGGGAEGEMAALYQRPTTQLQQELGASQATFKNVVGATTLGNVAHNNSIKAIEPMLDQLMAAKLAASSGGGGGGSGGGGGGHGGGGGGSDTLTNTELKTQLTGAATQTRQAAIADAAANLQAANKARSQARGQAKQAQQQTKQQTKVLKKQAKAAQKAGQQYQGGNNKAKTKAKLLALRQGILSHTLGTVGAARKEAQARTRAQGAAKIARAQYGNLVATGRQNLGDIARQIGVDAGVDPNQVYGVITPTLDKSFRLADVSAEKAAGGTLGQYGRAPTLGPRAVAPEIKVSPQKAKVMRSSANYRTLASAAQEAIGKGQTIQQFAKDLDTWRNPYPVKVKRHGKTITVQHPGHANLVNLVLYDFQPNFGR